MTWKVLVTAPYMLPVLDRFADFFAENDIEVVRADVKERLEESALLPLVSDIDGVISGDDRFTARVFDAAPKLKVIVKWGTGIDSIDREAAAKRNVAIRRTPDAFTEPAADSTIGYILAFARRLPWMDRLMKQGVWEKIPGRALNESTVGVVGVGAIGSAVLKRARPFGATLVGNDIRDIGTERAAALGVAMVSLPELLERSDFITLHCDLNPTSHHLIGAAELKAMKRTAVLINLARGPVIDETALVAALEAGDIAGAALDVFEDEPLPAASPLRAMDNVMLAPHNCNSSPRAWEAVHWSTVRQIADALRNRK